MIKRSKIMLTSAFFALDNAQYINKVKDMATGWSLGWKTNFWARMLDGNHAFKIISNNCRDAPSES